MTTHAIHRRDDGTIELTVTIPWEDVSHVYDHVVDDVVKNADVPGFRKGKAPKEVAEKNLRKEAIYDHLLRAYIPKVYSEIVQKEDMKPVVPPRIELDSAKEKMGITNENEDPYELIVLSIAADEDVYHFFPADESPETELWEHDYEAAQAMYENAMQDDEVAAGWREGLLKRSEQYKVDSGNDLVGVAFVEHINGKKYLCMSADTAERIIYKDETMQRDASYTEADYQNEVAILQHEYTHTQGHLQLESYNGVALEEYRAEHFSGGKNGYVDVKVFAQDLELVTGFSLRSVLDSRVKGGSPEAVLTDIVQHMGLANMFKVVSMLPQSYENSVSNQFQRGVIKYLGGTDGVIRSLHQEYVDKLGPEAASQLGGSVVDWFNSLELRSGMLAYRRGYSEYGSSILEQRADEII